MNTQEGRQNDPRFSPIDMSASIGDDRVRRLLEVRPQSDLVGHRSRGEEETSLLPGNLGDVTLEGGGGFVKVDIVANRGTKCIFLHLLRWDYVNEVQLSLV